MTHLQRVASTRVKVGRFGESLALRIAEATPMRWTPNKITLLRVAVGFAAVSLFGRAPWANLAAVALTVAVIALDALDGHIARRENLATPLGAQIDILGDRMIENVCFSYLGLELALARGPVALAGPLTADFHATIRAGALVLTWTTAAFCLVRGIPVLIEGWSYFAGNLKPAPRTELQRRELNA